MYSVIHVVAGIKPIKFKPGLMYNADGEQIDVARHAMSKLTIKSGLEVPPHSMLRKKL